MTLLWLTLWGGSSFSRITKPPGLLGLLPHEPVMGQSIVVKAGGEEYLAWQFVKHDYEDDGEPDGKSLDLACDLAAGRKNKCAF